MAEIWYGTELSIDHKVKFDSQYTAFKACINKVTTPEKTVRTSEDEGLTYSDQGLANLF